MWYWVLGRVEGASPSGWGDWKEVLPWARGLCWEAAPDSVGQGAMKKYDGANVRRQLRQMNSECECEYDVSARAGTHGGSWVQ